MVTDKIINFLTNSREKNEFFNSLYNQYQARNYLSPKQIARVEEAIAREERRNAPLPPPLPIEFSLKQGEIIEIKTWLAKNFKEELNMPFFFRNLEVAQVLDETAKSYVIKVQFVSKVTVSCHVCGRDLHNDISKVCGIGPHCAKKIGLKVPTLASAQNTLAEIEAIRIKIGVVGPIRVPKSQIKRVLREEVFSA